MERAVEIDSLVSIEIGGLIVQDEALEPLGELADVEADEHPTVQPDNLR